MKLYLWASLVFAVLTNFYSLEAFCQETTLKDRLKQRWIENQKKKPAPEVSSIQGEIDKTGTYTFSIESNSLKRYYMLYVPPQYNKELPQPLMIAMHGGGGSMLAQSRDEIYGLISKSKKEGFVVVFPNGYSSVASGAFASWNTGECCGEAQEKKSDDVGFIKDMLKDLKSKIRFQEDKVFAIGMSNGGMMAYRLACEAPELFKGIASVTGPDNTINCNPEKAIDVLHIHAKDDPIALIGGGKGQRAFMGKYPPINFRSLEDSISLWRQRYACSPTPKRVLTNEKAYCDRFEECKDGARIQVCVTEDGGHSWPGTQSIPIGKGKPSKAIVANDVIWDFFTK